MRKQPADQPPAIMTRSAEITVLGKSLEVPPPLVTAPRLDLQFLPPGRIGPKRLAAIEAVVRAGGAVGPDWIGYHLARAHLVSFALDGERVAGTVSLKKPRPEYVERLLRLTGLDLRGYLERGYTAVDPAYRGLRLATALVRGLTRRSEGMPTYTVIALDNAKARGVTSRAGTTLAASFYSEIKGKRIGIWLQGPLPDDPGASAWEGLP